MSKIIIILISLISFISSFSYGQMKYYYAGSNMKEFISENKKDNGFISDFHKTNSGKILFSKTKITSDNSVFDNTFKGSDLIYARCYLPQSIFNTPIYNLDDYSSEQKKDQLSRPDKCQFIIEMTINGKHPSEYKGLNSLFITDGYKKPFIDVMSMETFNTPDFGASDFFDGRYYISYPEKQTIINLFINSSEEDFLKKFDSKWKYIANALVPGEYEISLKLFPVWADRSGKILAKSKEPLVQGGYKYNKEQSVVISKGLAYLEAVPKAGLVDAVLENQVKALINNYTKDYQGHKAMKVVITDKGWTTIRHEISGKIVARIIEIWGVIKDSNGDCKQIKAIVTENFDGKSYGAPFLREGFVFTGDFYYINCNSVK